MLVACPECQLQVSDKAISCPHCGYPLKEINISGKSLPGNFRPSKRKYRRLPNGFGQITELHDPSLRNRFRAMVSVGKTEYGKPIQKLLKPRSYFPTYKEAYEALLEYHKKPYDIDDDITTKAVYERWLEQLSGPTKQYTSAWLYCSSVYDLPIRELHVRQIKYCIEHGAKIKGGVEIPPTASVKARIKNLFALILDYAMENEIVDKNYARVFKLSDTVYAEISDKEHHLSFTSNEMETLWQNINDPTAKLILFQCYSGWRPQELCLLLVENIHLDQHYMIGGMKTTAGKNRIVPIHPKIEPILEKYLNLANTLGSKYLFNVKSKKGKTPWIPLKYDRYYKDFNQLMTKLTFDPNHKPHDPRKHFITMAKQAKVDVYAIKRIVGHTITDVTEETYTDRTLQWLYEEICKI